MIEHGAASDMRVGRNILAAVLICGVAATAALPAASQNEAAAPEVAFGPDDIVSPQGLPDLGKWMIDQDGTVSHWLGATYEGKHIREPINVVLVDHGAASPEEAKDRLVAAVTAAGYPSREGHSGGYRGFIAGEFHAQLPQEPHHAFSNRPYVFDNNHGRIFGPAVFDGSHVFIGALSSERIAPFADPGHQYASFDRARDDFTQNLDSRSAYRIVGFVDLDNAIVADPQVTTGDHDGRAVLLHMDE